MTLFIWFMMWIAALQAAAPQPPQRGLPPGATPQRRGVPPQQRAPTTPPRPNVVPLPQVQASSPESKYICTEPVASERDQNGRIQAPLCASIEGVVVRASSNVGIANAHVTLGPAGGGALSESLEVVADSNGRFIFPSLNPVFPPAGYSLTADADGYQSAGYEPAGDNQVGESFGLPRGAHLHLTIKLNPYQTASGTVRTADTLPVAAALVRAYRVRYSLLGRRMKIVKSGLTTDLGDYRLFGLEPGDYYVSASYSEHARERPLFGATLTPNLTNPDAGFVTQYYPAAVAPPRATVFTMVPGQEKSNLNFVLTDAERFKIHVRVFAASNALTHHFNIALIPEGAELEDASDYAIDTKGSA
ncbi:MAG TPA: carboxypeptidase-like regulatory domain-containing protein, partial [Terriglobia bacterium]|nr:carboxypeptidase-like regulatory domain-containing protein [Terriglobia bacterium]